MQLPQIPITIVRKDTLAKLRDTEQKLKEAQDEPKVLVIQPEEVDPLVLNLKRIQNLLLVVCLVVLLYYVLKMVRKW